MAEMLAETAEAEAEIEPETVHALAQRLTDEQLEPFKAQLIADIAAEQARLKAAKDSDSSRPPAVRRKLDRTHGSPVPVLEAILHTPDILAVVAAAAILREEQQSADTSQQL